MELIERQRKAIATINEKVGLVNLPAQVKHMIANAASFEQKVLMLEYVAEVADRVDWATF